MVLTIDELAAAAGCTTRSIRSFQTLGLLAHPVLHGRTGVYGDRHRQRLSAILRLQSQGFSLQSLSILFAAHDRGESLGALLGLPEPVSGSQGTAGDPDDEAERYGFGDLQRNHPGRRGRPLLAIVPTTVWSEPAAS